MQFPELKYNFPYKIVTLPDNISVAYYDEGSSNNVLLFIHGLASYMQDWRKLTSLMTDDFRCIAIDLPGYGKSWEGVHSGGQTFYTKIIRDFILTLGLKKVNLVGHSMGGQISISTTLQYPEVVQNLILLAPAGFETFTADETKLLKQSFTAKSFAASSSKKQVERSYKANFSSPPQDLEYLAKNRIAMRKWANFENYCQVVANSFAGMLNEPVFGQMHKITQPTIAIYGKQDNFIPQPILHPIKTTEEIVQTACVQIMNSTYFMIENCGHFVQLEQPFVTTGIIKNFLSR
jgi:pimeloyl-ACP methyl ester carboxylesterase